MRSQSSFILHYKVHPLFIEKFVHNDRGKKEKENCIIEKDEVKKSPYKSPLNTIKSINLLKG